MPEFDTISQSDTQLDWFYYRLRKLLSITSVADSWASSHSWASSDSQFKTSNLFFRWSTISADLSMNGTPTPPFAFGINPGPTMMTELTYQNPEPEVVDLSICRWTPVLPLTYCIYPPPPEPKVPPPSADLSICHWHCPCDVESNLSIITQVTSYFTN